MHQTPSTSIEDTLLDRIYLGCSDAASWLRMLREISALLKIEDIACCHDTARLASERVFTVLDPDRLDEEAYGAVLEQSSHCAPLEADLSCCTLIGPEDGHDGYWLILRDAVPQIEAAFLFRRETAPFTRDEITFLVDVSPHLFRAKKLRSHIEKTAAREQTALALLDMLKTPIFLVDTDLSVVLANAPAQTLERNGVVRLHRQRLSFECADAMKRARLAVKEIGSDQPEEDRLIRLDQPKGPPLLAVIEPLNDLFPKHDLAPQTAVAAIFLKDTERPIHSVDAVMREIHGMPPAEARLAAAITDGQTIKEYAAKTGLSEVYVRDLSKRIMQRLGVRSQPQLVRAIIQATPEIGG